MGCIKNSLCVTVIVSLLLSQNIFAASDRTDFDPAEPRCVRADDKTIDRLLSELHKAEQLLPNIPPEENNYLSVESAAAMRVFEDERTSDKHHVRSTKMYKDLHSRQLYTVWAFKKTIEPARIALTKVLQIERQDFIAYRKNAEAEKLERTTNAIPDMVALTIAMNRVYQKLENGEILTTGYDNNYLLLRISEGEMIDDLRAFASCKLAKIMGRQTFE